MDVARLHRRLAVAVAVVAAATLGPSVTAWAGFAAPTAAAHTLSSATLQPVSGLSVTTGCALVLLGPEADLSWTATPSTFAAGYTVERWRGSTLEDTTTVTPRTTTSLTQTGLATGTTYTWRLRASYRAWTSTAVSVTKSTPGLCL
jgi:hypothetical protein